MNLATYAKIEQTGGGEFIKFEKTGEVRYLRFLYESGGENMGEDVEFYRKYWDEEAKRYVVGTDKGRLMAALRAIEYDEDGQNPRIVRWERSAYFCKTVLLPMWRNYPRIIDGVWKITATSPKTLDASYAIFPVVNADTIKYRLSEILRRRRRIRILPARVIKRKQHSPPRRMLSLYRLERYRGRSIGNSLC